MYTQEQLAAINEAGRNLPSLRPRMSAAELRTEQQRDPNGFLDAARGVFSGLEQGVRSVWDLADHITPGNLWNPWESFNQGENLIDDPETMFGGILKGFSQFAVGFLPGVKAVSLVTKGLGTTKALSWAAAVPNRVTALAAAGKTTQAMFLNAATSGVAAGAIADFVAFQEDADRLSNFLQTQGIDNPVVDFLAADGDDGVLMGRLKNVLEGGLIGIPAQLGLDTILRAAGRGRFARKAMEAGKSQEEATLGAVEAFPETPVPTRSTVVPDDAPPVTGALNQFSVGGRDYVVEVDTFRDTPGGEVGFEVVFGRTEGGEKVFRPDGEEDQPVKFFGELSRRTTEILKERAATLPDDRAVVVLLGAGDPKRLSLYKKFGERIVDQLGGSLRVVTGEESGSGVWLSLKAGDIKKVSGSTSRRLKIVPNAAFPEPTVTPKVTTEAPTEVTLADGTVSKRAKLERERAAVAKEITSRIEREDLQVGRPLGPKPVDEILDTFDESFGREGDLNVNPRKQSPETLNTLGITKGYLNRSKNIFTGDDQAGAEIVRAAANEGWVKADPSNSSMTEVRAKDADALNKALGGSATDFQRLLAKAKNQPDLVHAAGHIGRVVRNIAEGAAPEVRDAIKRIKAEGKADTLAAREVVTRARAVANMFEAVRDIWSGLGFELRNTQLKVTPKPFKGGVRKGGKSVMNWSTLDELENLVSAGVTPETTAKFRTLLDEIDAVMGSPDPLEAMTALKNWMEAPRSKKLGEMIMEWFINSILSTPASWVANGLSGLNMSVFYPVRRMVGAKFMGAQGSIADEIVKREIAKETRFANSFIRGVGEAWKISKNGGGRNYRKLTKFDIQDGFSPLKQGLKDTFGNAGALAGQVFTFPSWIMNRTDDFLKVLNYRARASAELYELAVKEGVPEAQIGEYIEDSLKIMTDDRAKLKQQASIESVLPDALASGADDIEAEVLKRMDPNHKAVQRLLDIHDRSIAQGERGTFTNDLNKESGFISSLGAHAQALVKDHPAMRLMLPFIRTPTNIAQFTWDHTFGTTLQIAMDQSRRLGKKILGSEAVDRSVGKLYQELRSIDPSVRADAAGRVAISLSFMGVATGVYASQVLADDFPIFTGSGPQDKEERLALEAAGWQPFSIRVNGKYISYQRFDPFASLLGIVADWVDLSHRMALDPAASLLEEWSVPIISALAYNITSKTYLEGLSNMLSIASGDTDGIKRAFGSTAGGFVPGALRGAVGELDPNMREIRSILDRVLTRVPGMSATLAPRRNMLGEIVKRPTTTGIHTADMFLPTRMMSISDDIIMQEVAQAKFGFNITPLRYKGVDLTDSIYTKDEQDAYDRFGELKGTVRVSGLTLRQQLRKLIQSPAFQALPTEPDEVGNQSPRVYLMNGVLNRYQKEAWKKLVQENKEVRNAAELVTTARRAARRPSLLS